MSVWCGGGVASCDKQREREREGIKRLEKEKKKERNKKKVEAFSWKLGDCGFLTKLRPILSGLSEKNDKMGLKYTNFTRGLTHMGWCE